LGFIYLYYGIFIINDLKSRRNFISCTQIIIENKIKTMKLHFKNSLPAFACILLIFSCKKNDPVQENNTSDKVKRYTEVVSNFSTVSGDTFNVSYDNSNRLVSLISPTSGNQFLYTYNGNSSYVLDIKNGALLVIHGVFYMNANLLIDSAFQYNNTNDSTTMKFVYNAGKQLIEQRTYGYSLPAGAVLFRKNSYTYDVNGNVLKDTETGSTGGTNFVKTYTYTNVTGTTFSLATIYTPVLYKKLPATTSVYYPGSNTTVTSDYTYVYDAANRVTKETITNSAGNFVTRRFEYY
jgi:hypothetical protein